jgi:hypothetical protein
MLLFSARIGDDRRRPKRGGQGAFASGLARRMPLRCGERIRGVGMAGFLSNRLFGVCAALFAAVAAASCASAAPAAETKPAVVAIGDLHGDYDAYFGLVRSAGIVDAKGRWTGGKTIFVQTGDVPDRGPDTRKIIDSLMKLEKAAKKKGGAVIALVGNHEAMNVSGDLRYVTPQEYAAFKTSNSKRVRDAYFKNNYETLAAHYRAGDAAMTDAAVRAAFDAEVPLGYLEQRAAWNPKGKFGAWVASHDAMRVIGNTLFVHGGVSSAYAATPIATVNEQVRAALRVGSGAILTDAQGPLWYRGNTEETPAGEAEVAAALSAFGVKRIVIGHTLSTSGIKTLYGGRIVMIDTGISATYGGTKSYLKIDGDTLTAIDNGAARTIGGQ